MSIQKNYSRKKMPQMARSGKNQHGDPKPKIKCQKCKEYLGQHKFSLVNKNNNEEGRRSICKSCSAKRAKIEREKRKNNWKYKPSLAMLNNSKQRAKKYNIEHNILLEDIVIPEYCPVLGIKLETGDRKLHYNAPSIDRIDNNKGYTKDNIFIMSTKANLLKRDASLEELILIGKWANKMKGKIN